MNNYLPPELKDLSASKKRVMQNVMDKVETTPTKPKREWRFTLMTVVVLASALFFVFQVTIDKDDGNPGSGTPQVEDEPVDLVESPSEEDKTPMDKAQLDLSKPLFTNEEGVFRLHGITVGDTQEDVIEQLGESYTLEDDLDGTGADLAWNYNDKLIVLFFNNKVDSILFLDVEVLYGNQMYMDATGIKFMADTMRFIYSVETSHLIKMEYEPNGKMIVRLMQNSDPNFGTHSGFVLKQLKENRFQIALNHSQPIVSIAKENLYLHGITLGDPESKVIAYFGESDADKGTEKGDGVNSTLSYGDEMEFHFVGGKLQSMRFLKVDESYFYRMLEDFEGVDLYSAETSQRISTEHSKTGDLIVTLHYSDK